VGDVVRAQWSSGLPAGSCQKLSTHLALQTMTLCLFLGGWQVKQFPGTLATEIQGGPQGYRVQNVNDEGDIVCVTHAEKVTDEAATHWLNGTTAVEPGEIAAIVMDVCGVLKFNADPVDMDGSVMRYGPDVAQC
jgi:hypothetical protein